MKIPMIMMMAGAAIGFAAPMANATFDRTLPQHQKAVKHVKTAKAKTKTTPTIKPTPRPPLYIYVPGFTGTPSVSAGTNDCERENVSTLAF